MKTVKAKLIFFLFALLFVSCINDNKEKEENNTVNRIVLAYFGGDNNLSGDAKEKIEAMRAGWNSSIEGRLFVFSDLPGEKPELSEICLCSKGNPIKRNIYTYAEDVNSADPAILSDAIKRVTENYIADSYGLIVFSHASGWLPEGTLSDPYKSTERSIITDQSKEMEFLDFTSAIPDNTFDFIVFEACLMANIEVVYELKDKTDYILASAAEIIEPGFRDIYESHIGYLFKKKADIEGFAQKAFEYYNNLSGVWQSATFSVVKTSEVKNLGNWIASNCEHPENVEINLNQIQKFNRSSYKLFFDFEDYYSKLIDEDKQAELNSLLEKCITYKAATKRFMDGYTGFTINKHSGITTYVLNENYPYLNEKYKKLKWFEDVYSVIENK